MYNLLSGLSVIEASSFVASPTAGLYCAQFGAEVIRVDQIGGGPDYRRWPVTQENNSLYWENLNRAKKSVALDLGRPEGRELLQELVRATGQFITNFPAGGPADFLARSVGEYITTQSKQAVGVENKPGAGGNIGADFVAKSPADGYTVLFGIDTTFTVNPYIYKNMAFKPADLRTVMVVGSSGLLVGVHPSNGFKTMADFRAFKQMQREFAPDTEMASRYLSRGATGFYELQAQRAQEAAEELARAQHVVNMETAHHEAGMRNAAIAAAA